MSLTPYKNPPIVEAIINIQFNIDEPCSLENIEAFGKSINTVYPISHKLWETSVQISPGNNSETATDFQIVGYRFETASDPKRILQLRPDSFTLSWLPPYDRWEVFREEAKSLWQDFWPIVQRAEIQRLALRYINRIDIEYMPGDLVELEDYFTIFPHVPDKAALEYLTMSAAILQVHMPQPDIQGILLVNQAIVPPVRENTMSILLDLDISSNQGWGLDDTDAWIFMDRLRDRKNEAFESFITEKTKELF